MFRWWPKKDIDLPQLKKLGDFEELLRRDVVIIFKHSPTCQVSWAAHAQVVRFHAANPELPLYMLCVRTERELSRTVAQRIRVEHASPQIILLRGGSVLCEASHDEITRDFLEEALASV
jgi:bacillithiol system protein YtxJ